MFRLIESSSGKFTNHIDDEDDDHDDVNYNNNNNKLFAGGTCIKIMLIHNCRFHPFTGHEGPQGE